ncbi:hypothetical protein E0198_000919 [Clavispora lusitaniae]|nr:hypothetical protein E0198_000919 [Clavispora lusitaniae]
MDWNNKRTFRSPHSPVASVAPSFSSQYPLYAADWANDGSDWIALGSFREGFSNRIQVIRGDVDTGSPMSAAECHAGSSFASMAETAVDYPVTRLQWEPHSAQRLAASSEVLRLYQMEDEGLVQTHMLANNSAGDGDVSTFPPVTAFDWNRADPSVLITSSVDTTCTVWDLGRSTAHVKTQLIAHDSEVFDVRFLYQSTSVFASVSNDGSMRVFDLRSLEHSTIVYEPPGAPGPTTNYNPLALVRLSASNVDQHHLATVGVNSNQVLVIDMRMPGVPVTTLDASFGGLATGAVNSLEWHPQSNLLLTGGDDCQAVVWDIGSTRPQPEPITIDTPVLAHSEDLEVNRVCWRPSGDWIGVVSGKDFRAVQA